MLTADQDGIGLKISLFSAVAKGRRIQQRES